MKPTYTKKKYDNSNYPTDPRNMETLLWELLLREHDIFDEFLADAEGKIYMRKQSPTLKQFFKDIKSKLLEPSSIKYHAQEQPFKQEESEEPKTTISGIKGKRRSAY